MENWNPEHSVRPGHLLMVWLEHQWHSSLVFTGTVTSIREAKDIKEGDGKRRRGHYTPGCAEGKGRGLRSDQQSWWVLCLLVQTTSDTTSDSQTNREEKKNKKTLRSLPDHFRLKLLALFKTTRLLFSRNLPTNSFILHLFGHKKQRLLLWPNQISDLIFFIFF